MIKSKINTFNRTKIKFNYFINRIFTILSSIRTIYKLSPEKVNDFLASYEMFDLDWVDEEHLIEKLGMDYYQEIQKKLVHYYSVLNHLCAIGQVEKMYIPPIMDTSASIRTNQLLFEKQMSLDLNLKSNSEVLDIGCGRGKIACHIASLTGANVTGINIDTNQLESARKFTKGKDLAEQCRFKQADFNLLPLPFPDNSLNAAYEIQAFSYAKTLTAICRDVYRILTSKGRFACLDWVQLDKYDSQNSEHTNLMKQIKPLIGAIGTPTIEGFESAFKEAGFKILISKNISINGLQAPLIENADRFFKLIAHIVHRLVKWNLIPQHFKILFDRLTKDGQAFIKADYKGLVTTSYYIMGEKS